MEASDERSRNGWKVLLIVIAIIALIAAVAVPSYLIGRDSGEEDEDNGNGTTVTQPEAEPEEPAAPVTGGDGAADPGTTDVPADPPADTTTERYVTGYGEGSTPCIGGFVTTTRQTYWSDGSVDTETITEPCP